MLVVSTMATYMFDACVVAFPEMATFYRANAYSVPIVSAHRPIEEICSAIASAVVDLLPTSMTFVGVGPGANASPGPFPVTPADFSVAGPAAKTDAVQDTQTALGWVGKSGPSLIEVLMRAMMDYITLNLTLSTSTGLTDAGSGGTMSISAGSLPSGSAISAAALAILSDAGQFYKNDNPSLGLAPSLVNMIDAYCSGVPGVCAALGGVVTISPIGPATATTMSIAAGSVS
jgi:hypothetical protein